MLRALGVAAGVLLLVAGCGHTSPPEPAPSAADTIHISSPAFPTDGPIPAAFTCRGVGLSPPLSWTGIPARAAALALVVDDPCPPSGTHHYRFTLYALRAELTLPANPTLEQALQAIDAATLARGQLVGTFQH